MPNGYLIINEKQEEITFELADEVKYTFTDFGKEADSEKDADINRLKTATNKDEFLQHLSEYDLNDIPLFEQTIPCNFYSPYDMITIDVNDLSFR